MGDASDSGVRGWGGGEPGGADLAGFGCKDRSDVLPGRGLSFHFVPASENRRVIVSRPMRDGNARLGSMRAEAPNPG